MPNDQREEVKLSETGLLRAASRYQDIPKDEREEGLTV